MFNIRIWCFGNLVVEKDGQVVKQFDTDKARALLVFLAMERGRPVSRSYLAGLLWSDLAEQRALQSLRQTLSILRRALGDSSPNESVVVGERDLLQLNPKITVWVDALAYKDELAAALEYFQRQDLLHSLNIRRLGKALSWKKGDFLEHFSVSGASLFDDWACLMREDLNHRAVEGLGLLARYQETRGEFGLARVTTQKILQIAPWDEMAHLQMMKLYALDNQWSSFFGQFQKLRQYLFDQLGVQPSQAAINFFEEVREKRLGAPSLQMPPMPSANFLGESRLFVGRENELDDISDLLSKPTCRLLTLHGPGGIGKTSLAQEVARQQYGLYQDGVYFFSFTSLASHEEFLSSIVDGLKIPIGESRNKQVHLLRYLRNKCLLLVFDNFEHLVDNEEITRATLEILVGSKAVKILVTSRERLNLASEWVYSLQGMRFPVEVSEVCAEQVEVFDSLALFQLRARQTNPAFQLNDHTLPAVAQICQILDGLPLGITLAAAETWDRSCQAIAEMMSENLSGLCASTQGVELRNRGLWLNLDISWNLMDEPSRKIFARLGVFVEGFNVFAAEKIASADLQVLERMVDRSLILCCANKRYKMHSVIRQYAVEQLGRLSEQEMTRFAFVDYYAGFLARLLPDLKSDRQIVALNEIQAELGNIKQAWMWLVDIEGIQFIASYVEALHLFFNIRSRFQEGIDFIFPVLTWLKGKMDRGGDRGMEIATAMVLARIGSLAHLCRVNELARESIEIALGIFNKHAQIDEAAFCKLVLADIHLRNKDFSRAVKIAQETHVYYKKLGEASNYSQSAYMLGLIDLRRGRMESARKYMTEALKMSRVAREPRRIIAPLNILGDIYCNDGKYAEAVEMFEESLTVADQLGDLFQKAILLNNIASVHHVSFEYDKAVEMYEKSLEICREIGDQDGEAIALTNLGEIAVARKDFDGAIALAEQALLITREIGEEWSVAVCLNFLAEAHLALGKCDAARKAVNQALDIALRTDAMRLVARFIVTYGRCSWMLGDKEAAANCFRAALAHSATEFDVREKAQTWLEDAGAVSLPDREDGVLRQVAENVLNGLR